MKRTRTLATVAFAALATPATTSAQPAPPQRTITVTATGEVRATPDVAHVSAGVVTEAPAAQDALGANGKLMTKVIASIKASGVQASDIQTSNLDISPRYSAPRDGAEPRLTGYSVRNQVRFTYRTLATLGDALDKLVAAGANQMHGISFEVTNADALLDDARKAAVAKATARAQLYAKAANATLGDVLTIDETPQASHGPYPRQRGMMASAVPVESGAETLAVNVTVTFALK